jgi:transposase InsO family protein
MEYIGEGRRCRWYKKDIYAVAGVSKQAVNKYKEKVQRQVVEISIMECIVKEERTKHKKLGLRKIYRIHWEEIPVGRDEFERIMIEMGYGIGRQRNWRVTTRVSRGYEYPNLIKGLVLDGINQVWQSDITYLKYRKKIYYLVLIIDVYSRYIVGYELSRDLSTQSNLNALNMALRSRGKERYDGLIHHSDRGSQYGSKEYTHKLKEHGIAISMCKEAWENAYAERVNGTIKKEYLDFISFDESRPLTPQITSSIRLYNEERPHWGLDDMRSPGLFERYTEGMQKIQRPRMTLYTEVSKSDEGDIESPSSDSDRGLRIALPDVSDRVTVW